MNKKFTRILAAFALLVFMTPTMVGWGQTRANYTIAFQSSTSSSDATSELSESQALAAIESGASYVTSISSISKVYKGKSGYGWKLGTGSAVGTFVMNLSTDGLVTATKITVKTAKYSSDTGKVKVTLNNNSNLTHEITPSTDLTDDEWTLTSPTAITSIKIETTSKRAYVHSVVVTYGAAYSINVNPDFVSVDHQVHTSGYGGDENLSMTTNISGTNPNAFIVHYCDTEDGNYTSTAPDWMNAWVAYTNSFNVGWYIDENTSTTNANECYFKIYNEANNVYSNAVHVMQSAAPVPTYSVTLNTYSISADYAGDEGALGITLSSNMSVSSEENFFVEYLSNNEWVSTNPNNWFSAEVVEDDGDYNVSYEIVQNQTNEPRSCQFRIYVIDDEYNEAYSDPVTVTQTPQPQVATPTFNPVAGAVLGGTQVTISSTDGAVIYYTTDGTNPTIQSATYSGPITVNAAMTIKAIAVKEGYIDSEMAAAAYTILTVTDIATARAAEEGQTVSIVGIVTNNSSNTTLYVQDETAAIRVYGEDLGYSAGTQITVTGTIGIHNNTKQITEPTISVVSTNNELPYQVKTIAEIKTDNYNNFQNLRVQIVEATVTSKTGSNTNIKQGDDNELLVYGSMSGVSVGDVITLKGFVYLYTNNSTSTLEIQYPTDVVVKPTLTAADMVMAWNETSKTRVVTVNHPVEDAELMATTQDNWLSLSVSGTSVTITTTANTSAERTATISLEYKLDGQTLASGSFNVTQATKPTMCLVSFNVNGSIAMTAEVPEGASLDLSNFAAPITSDTYTFVGWSLSTSDIAVISTFTPSASTATLYAVYSEGGGDYEKVESALSDWSGTYLIVYESGSVAFNGSLNTFDAVSNTISVTINNKKIVSNSTTDASNFTISAMDEGYSIKGASGKYVGRTGNSNGMNTSTTAIANSISYDDDNNCITITSNNLYLRYNKTSGQTRFRYFTNTNQEAIQLYKKASGSYVINQSGTPTIVSIPSTIVVTVKSGNTVNLTGANNGSTANLIIEDGAQLVANNAVNATLQKEIAGFGSDNSVKTGWYTIASPLTTAVAPASNMLANTYDLYYYDEADFKWYNYKPNNAHSGFSIEPNKGYLYANSGDITLSFSGMMRASNANVSLPLSYASSTENAKGFNLVGNPFTYNLTNSSNIMIGGSSFSTYYVADGTVNNEGKNLIAYNIVDRPIKPGEGFFVQATAADQSLVFNGRGRGEQNAYIRILAGNENFIDRAYVQFGGGNTLRKMTLSDNTAKVYVMQDNKDYAAAIIEKAQGEMPVNFKASANGTYTVTVNPEGVELNYLHLIDNMTGMDVDLLQTPSYTFNATTRDYESRFCLVFAANNEDGVSTGSTAFAFYSNGNWIINNVGDATLQVIDVTGRVLSSETVSGSVSKTINAVPGVYMLRLINGENVNVQKIVVR